MHNKAELPSPSSPEQLSFRPSGVVGRSAEHTQLLA